MDLHCTDICPIVSQELIDAYHDFGPRVAHVVFLAANVNQYHYSVAAVDTFSKEHSLNSVPSWHFLTGLPTNLKPILADYGIAVDAPSRNADIIHTSLIYFIDPKGRERYLANPTDRHTASGRAYLRAATITSWGQGIAQVIKSMVK
jgi:cytochrome oxidase Cu insertion factor (SCO1/SenC/PrrC family)